MAEQNNSNNANNPVASIALPSADLISYRFDQNDNNLADLKKANAEQFNQLSIKLDNMAGTYITKEEVNLLRTNSQAEHLALWTEIKAMKATVRWWVGILLTICGICAAFMMK